MYAAKPRYGELLLTLLRREIIHGHEGAVNHARVNALCDRFERLLSLLFVPPLVWDGDYA